MGRLLLSQSAVIVLACATMAGCAITPKPTGSLPVKVNSSGPVEITSATALILPYGLVVKGMIHIGPNIQIAAVHSVDVSIAGPDGKEIRKFTTQYFPAPKIYKKKPQQAHFTLVTYSVPPPGSVISVSLTPEPKVDHPDDQDGDSLAETGGPTPENR